MSQDLLYIFALERGLNCSRELIYCTALLHDIGRIRQYMDGTPHDEAGVQIAEQILSILLFLLQKKEADSDGKSGNIVPQKMKLIP